MGQPGVSVNAHAVRGQLREQIALYVAAYRRAGCDPSLMQAASLAAFPAAEPGDYAVGLVLANRAELGKGGGRA